MIDQYATAELVGIHDALKRLAALAQQDPTPQSSVEITRNTKGAQWVVKVYAADPDQACSEAQRLYDQLASRYGTQQQCDG